ncbi:hypothetical protein F4804DRAFT_317303 [Jackrogersella minutella]|nr:hypothetical protein F4804DRAFT_317303 [Jackrogersella minutella]
MPTHHAVNEHHGRAPEPTMFVSAPQMVGRQADSSTPTSHASSAGWKVISSDAVSFATSIASLADAIASGFADHFPPDKREEATPTMTSSAVMAAATNATAGCDCIGACSDIDGKAAQMRCIKTCAKDCDGDDDSKAKTDVLGDLSKSLTGSLGLGGRAMVPAKLEHAQMSQSGKIVQKKGLEQEADYPAAKPPAPKPQPKPETYPQHVDSYPVKAPAPAPKPETYPQSYPVKAPAPKPDPKPEHKPEHEKEHKPEHEKEHKPEHEKEHKPEHEKEHKPEHKDDHHDPKHDHKKEPKHIDNYPAKAPAPTPLSYPYGLHGRDNLRYPTKNHLPRPSAEVSHESAKASESEEFEACMKKCSTRNCKHSSVGIDLDQCDNTSCEENCAGHKQGHSGEISKTTGKIHARQQHVPYSGSPAPQPAPHSAHHDHAHKPAPRPNLPAPPPAPASAHFSAEEDFESCMNKCSTRNCQHSSVGLDIDQCGNTSCEQHCAKFRKSAHGSINKRNEHPSGPIAEVQAVPELAPVAATPNRPSSHTSPNPHAAPGLSPAHEGATAVKGGSKDFEACMSQCKSRNCQHSGVGIDIEQCGDTSCESACAEYKEADSAMIGKEKQYDGTKIIKNPGIGPKILAVPNEHDVPVGQAHESQEYQDCMSKCKTHNCQKADIGLDVSQCGSTSCEEGCVKFQGQAGASFHG